VGREGAEEVLSLPVDGLHCQSCGVQFANHLGLIGTCQKLKEANAEIERLKAICETPVPSPQQYEEVYAENKRLRAAVVISTGPCNTTHHACDCVIRNLERAERVVKAARAYVTDYDNNKGVSARWVELVRALEAK
jgi:hypothetical protein